MKSSRRGKPTSAVEVTNISAHGFWLYVKGAEHFLPFADYPWFEKAKIAEILNVKLIHGRHLHWPDLDVDLELESLQDPQAYPLVYR